FLFSRTGQHYQKGNRRFKFPTHFPLCTPPLFLLFFLLFSSSLSSLTHLTQYIMEPPIQRPSSSTLSRADLVKQTPAKQNPMLLPEIITRVGQFLPLWSSNGFAREFNPLPLLHCALVSHTFRDCLL